MLQVALEVIKFQNAARVLDVENVINKHHTSLCDSNKNQEKESVSTAKPFTAKYHKNDNPIISIVNMVGVGNPDTVSQFSEHVSASSDANTNKNYDDGYEKPYTTLMVQNRADDENGIITQTHVLTTEECIIESGHYTEINEDDYRQTILQENENSIISTVIVIGVNNTDTAAQSSGQSSGSFDNNIDTSEGYYDGYEKPYTTLMVQQRADDEHVYHNTNTFYENATPFDKACPDRPFGENKNPSTIDNDVDKNDKDLNRSHIDPPKYKAQNINLMLK
ncbi:Hypothetical predicted protein [Mytilus galloprovincialis]|uniref:Uncharacterized protein n=1 Tax=Mytilus galloprovincialis TaxID=29158 RepID=A0A8B6EQB8_MYTGA|nr:Hypothetical predicted protein [Mytilus galloprovincialis]